MSQTSYHPIPIKIATHSGEDGNKLFTYQGQIFPNGTRKIIHVSENVIDILGISAEEILERPHRFNSLILPKYHKKLASLEQYCNKNLSLFDVEFETRTVGGEVIWVHNTAIPKKLEDGSLIWNGVQRVITARKNKEYLYKKYLHEVTLMNAINDIVLTSTDEGAFLQNICEALVETGKFSLAWILMFPNAEESLHQLKPTAAYGETAYLKNLLITLSSQNEKNLKIFEMLSSGQNIIADLRDNNSLFSDYTEKAAQFNLNSAVLIPIFIHSKFQGSLHVYSKEPDGFKEEEVSLINNLSFYISSAIKNIRDRIEKEKTTNLLNIKLKELNTLFEFNKLILESHETVYNTIVKITELIPRGWQYPACCEVKFDFGGHSFSTQGYQNNRYILSTPIITEDGTKGSISVIYTEDKPTCDFGPFLSEEKKLLETMAEKFVLYYNKQIAIDALVKSELNLKTIFENNTVGFLLTDLSLNVLAMNHHFKDFVELYQEVDFKYNKNLIQSLKPSRSILIKTLTDSALQFKTLVNHLFEFNLNTETHFIDGNIIPVLNNHEVIGFCFWFQDITSDIQLENERIKITDDLIQRNRDLEQFAFIVSHNLRGPVANILGLNNLLTENIAIDIKNEIIQKIRESSKRLDEVITDLNTILHIRRDIKELSDTIKLSKVLKSTEDLLEHTIQSCNATITHNFDTINKVQAIRSYMESVFYHLIQNSIKYAKENVPPIIHIESTIENNQIVITFKDNGMGINLEKYGKNLFKLYQRFHIHVEGKGLGLYMVKTQIESMGGHIEMESELDIGTTILVKLPLKYLEDAI